VWSQLVTLVSLDVVSSLVGAGYTTRTLPITDASNTSPIVLTCASPHGFSTTWPIHIVISGALGNTNANGTWIAVPTDDTHLALYTMAPDGTQSPVAGSGAYAGGATVSMALTDGRILMGRQHVKERSSAPRIVFIPVRSKWGPKSVYNRSQVQGYPSAEVRLQNQIRSLRTETTDFEVHVWGVAIPPDPEGGDFDATQVLYQQVIRTLHHLAMGNYNITDGTFTDQQPSGTQLVKTGHEFVFGVTFDTPILDILLPYAPPGTAPGPVIPTSSDGPGVYLQNPGGGPPEPA